MIWEGKRLSKALGGYDVKGRQPASVFAHTVDLQSFPLFVPISRIALSFPDTHMPFVPQFVHALTSNGPHTSNPKYKRKTGKKEE